MPSCPTRSLRARRSRATRWRGRASRCSFRSLLPGFTLARHELETARAEGGPTGLMARTDTAAVVSVEVLAEEHQISESGIFCVPSLFAMARTRTVLSRQEDPREPSSELGGDLAQREILPRTR